MNVPWLVEKAWLPRNPGMSSLVILRWTPFTWLNWLISVRRWRVKTAFCERNSVSINCRHDGFCSVVNTTSQVNLSFLFRIFNDPAYASSGIKTLLPRYDATIPSVNRATVSYPCGSFEESISLSDASPSDPPCLWIDSYNQTFWMTLFISRSNDALQGSRLQDRASSRKRMDRIYVGTEIVQIHIMNICIVDGVLCWNPSSKKMISDNPLLQDAQTVFMLKFATMSRSRSKL